MTQFDYEFVLEIARHGARGPPVVFEGLAVNEADNFSQRMALTDLGADQHYRLGQNFVRETYFKDREPNLDEIYNV